MVKMSTKGQLVVPEAIRDAAGFEPGDRFIPMPLKEGVLFKRVSIPDIRAEFAQLAKETKAAFRKSKAARKDITEAIKWARRDSSSTRTS